MNIINLSAGNSNPKDINKEGITYCIHHLSVTGRQWFPKLWCRGELFLLLRGHQASQLQPIPVWLIGGWRNMTDRSNLTLPLGQYWDATHSSRSMWSIAFVVSCTLRISAPFSCNDLLPSADTFLGLLCPLKARHDTAVAAYSFNPWTMSCYWTDLFLYISIYLLATLFSSSKVIWTALSSASGLFEWDSVHHSWIGWVIMKVALAGHKERGMLVSHVVK